ncbi:MAG: UDP-glucose/GDP-mannose dehydrogenase family protein, partial [Actinobacteria bacterium]|nr:UDP-glucose/GDP-mannose dehydrogenase family protein [Actinomycetota bacterium]
GVVAVNERQFDRVAGKIVAAADGSVADKTIAVWGLTFKAGTDDLRESPSIEIIDRLIARGAHVTAFDPVARTGPDGTSVTIATDPYAACEGAAVLAILTEWDEFRWLDFDKVADLMDRPVVVDTRNIVDRASLKRRGFTVVEIGRA